MTNHPNRNWRRRMQAAADQWLASSARVLYEMPIDPRKLAEGLRNRLCQAYLAGYQDGRKKGREVTSEVDQSVKQPPRTSSA